MRLRKTPLAHSALAAHRGPLGLRERRALILSDGQRSRRDLAALLGGDGEALLDALHRAGYLEQAEPASPAAAVAAAAPAPVSAPPVSAPSPPVQRRRSLAAARVYLQDMLELQHGLDHARLLRQGIADARDEAALLVAMGRALAELPDFTSGGYSARVRSRVLEALPEPARAQLAHWLCPGGTTPAAAQPQVST